jgi:hypothetical protein
VQGEVARLAEPEGLSIDRTSATPQSPYGDSSPCTGEPSMRRRSLRGTIPIREKRPAFLRVHLIRHSFVVTPEWSHMVENHALCGFLSVRPALPIRFIPHCGRSSPRPLKGKAFGSAPTDCRGEGKGRDTRSPKPPLCKGRWIGEAETEGLSMISPTGRDMLLRSAAKRRFRSSPLPAAESSPAGIGRKKMR